jgi:membrane protein implicated in regulation of membrane protease activity
MELSPLYIWLIAGVAFLIIEAIGINGFGMFFAGLGALFVGMVINFDLITEDNLLQQLVVFGLSTTIWAISLWKPIKKWHNGKKSSYNNMIGETATVADGGIFKQNGGAVKWSGTIMKAQIADDDAAENIAEGEKVIIKEIAGNTLTVTKKH